MTQDEAKRMAARQALEFVEDGMLLGLGSGSTSRMFIEELGERVKQGLRVRGIATSTTSRQLAESLSIPIVTFEEFPVLDLNSSRTKATLFLIVRAEKSSILRRRRRRSEAFRVLWTMACFSEWRRLP